MHSRHVLLFASIAVLLAGALALALWGGGGAGGAVPAGGGRGGEGDAASLTAEDVVAPERRGALDAVDPERQRLESEAAGDGCVVRGRVVDAVRGAPLAGVEVLALRRPPSLERLLSRVQALFREGLWSSPQAPAEVLGRGLTGADGAFELVGLPSGRVYLDGRSSAAYVRTSRAVRLAPGQTRDGVELIAAPGGGVRGVVLTPDGLGAAGAAVSVRPGLNAFLGQLTQRRYRWLEATADVDGRFSILGVPPGRGYVVTASHPRMALEEVHGIDVDAGRVSVVEVRGHVGASISGEVLGVDGRPLEGARVALVYLDVSRMLLSADGRTEPWTTGPDGRFDLGRVAAGRVALVADAEGLGASQIEELTVVDGGSYDDLVLELGAGRELRGRVLDEEGAALADARIEVRPMDRPDDPDASKMALRIRPVSARTDVDGLFTVAGLNADRVMVQAGKPGYVTEVRMRVGLDGEELAFQLMRSATLHGEVTLEDGSPVERFSVQVRSSIPGETEQRRGGPPWRRGRSRRVRLAEGTSLSDRQIGGDWRDFASADGRFSMPGVPPGDLRVRVRAEGLIESDEQRLELASGAESERLRFVLAEGATVRGIVVDQTTQRPVADAQVTGHKRRRSGGMPFSLELEDFDFLALSTNTGRRSGLTDSRGRFEVRGVAPGEYRFMARHPDLAKTSGVEVEVVAGQPVPDLRLELEAGGTIEGRVTGSGRQPLADAVVLAFSLSAGAIKSGTTDRAGQYRIEGLAPGQYVVFKTRMDERTVNLGYEFLGNLRLKSVTVRDGKVTKLDIHDEEEGTVRVYGVVRDDGKPVDRAMVTALSSDRDGILGMGVRARPTDAAGAFELVGMKPGSYVFQVVRFRERPQQAGLAIEVPDGVNEYRVDLDLPQSRIGGVVVDAAGAPMPGVRVQAGVEQVGGDQPGALLGLILDQGVARARTDDDGRFELPGMAEGVYRLSAAGRRLGGERRDRYGDAVLGGVAVDGRGSVDGLVMVLPEAGRLVGAVVDANGAAVVDAEVHYERVDETAGKRSSGLPDLFGIPVRPARTDAEGRFELAGVTPGTYRVRADADGLAPGVAEDVVVLSGGETAVDLQVVRGATLRLRVTRIDGTRLPNARVTILDGEGKPLADKVSVLSVFRRMMGNRQRKADSGWYEVGNVPPDTYTIVVQEPDQPEIRVRRRVRDGETVEWQVDMTEELEKLGR